MEKLRVLFVGNSHTFFNDMPTIFQMFCRENGIDAEVVMQAHPGVHLSWHLSQQWELRYGLVQGHFDYMVFQQAAHPCPPMEETLQDGSKIVELARAQGVKPIATITWCERRFPENQQKMYEIDALREKTGICCSPVGQVYQRVEREEKDIDLYWVDGEHASLYGSYVIAACAFARITGKSPIGLPYRSICSVPMDREKFAQVSELRRQADEKAMDAASGLSRELEATKAALRAKAEAKLQQAATLVVERIVNS